MKLEILEEVENPLFDRRELKVKVLHKAATPSWADVRDKISVLAKAKKDTVILDSIQSRFGIRESLALVRIYKTKDRALQIEPKHKLKKNFPKEEKVEKPEEKPTVEQKEEAKEEKTEEKQEQPEVKAKEAKEAEVVKTEPKEEKAKSKSKVKSKETSKEMEKEK
ncbi:MAG: hypothetical protein V3T58_05430 [Candidatus Hydrothermarchaeales archaeon]